MKSKIIFKKRLQFLTSFMYSSHFVYMMSTYFLCFWYGVLSFKRPIDIDLGKIQIVCLIFLITNELIRPFSVSQKLEKFFFFEKFQIFFQNDTILNTNFVIFIHILELEIFRKQKKFLMKFGFLNCDNMINGDFSWNSNLLETTVHAVF